MHTDSGMTGISLSGYMPYMTVASLEMSDEPKIILLNGFLKNSTKDYDKQIAKAVRILKDLAL